MTEANPPGDTPTPNGDPNTGAPNTGDPQNAQRERFAERFIDGALAEATGGATPPNVGDAVTAAAAAAQVASGAKENADAGGQPVGAKTPAPGSSAAPGTPSGRRAPRRAVRFAVVSTALLALCAFALVWIARPTYQAYMEDLGPQASAANSANPDVFGELSKRSVGRYGMERLDRPVTSLGAAEPNELPEPPRIRRETIAPGHAAPSGWTDPTAPRRSRLAEGATDERNEDPTDSPRFHDSEGLEGSASRSGSRPAEGQRRQREDTDGTVDNGSSAVPIRPGDAAGSAPRDDNKRPSKTKDGESSGKNGAGARLRTWKRAEIVPNASRLTIGDTEELQQRGLQVTVRIDGFRARVVLDAYYLNDRDRQYEGTFRLRLPNEATPFYFAFGATNVTVPPNVEAAKKVLPQFLPDDALVNVALEVEDLRAQRKTSWRTVKEARIVTKEKAARAYRETVRRRVDPALMEWAGAGVFAARVFPLAPRTLSRIVIAYDVTLQPVGDDLEYRLDLPANLPALAVSIDASKLAGVPMTIAPELAASVASDKGRVRYTTRDANLRTIAVRYEHPGPLAIAGIDAETGPYVAAHFRVPLPEGAASPVSEAVFLVDTSLSANPERFNVALKLLEAILTRNQATLTRFGVVFFNVEAYWYKGGFQKNTAANVAALIDDAQNLSLEGATDLGRALSVSRRIPGARGAAVSAPVFLLSDAAITWGERDVARLARLLADAKTKRSAPLYAYRTGFAGTDLRLLSALARETGGAVFTVAGEAEIASAATAHTKAPWAIEAIALAGATDVMLAGRPTTLYPGQPLTLVARGTLGKAPAVVLTLRRGDKSASVRVPLGRAQKSELAARTYGTIAVGQLEEFQRFTEATAKAYAVHFRVPGATCSLLMLESEADYQRFNIKPEEEAFIVKQTLATGAIRKALDAIGDQAGNPKLAFMAWLTRLQKMPGLKFELPESLRVALEAMPVESFAVRPQALACRARKFSDVPGALQEQLASRKLDYDAITKEADRRLAKYGAADALRALSSLIENRPGDAVLARDVGFSAMALGFGGHAIPLFRRVAEARPWEPQTYRALARSFERLGNADLALAYYEVCLRGNWDGRFGEFRRIVGLNYLRFLKGVAAGKLTTSVPDYAAARLRSVAREFDLGSADIVVMITWNTDGTDVDLHVIEPTGEDCHYGNRDTRLGGHLTTDVTQGYGPEMYVIKSAAPGTYKVQVYYFASDSNRATTRTKVSITIFERWGTPTERVVDRTTVLTRGKDVHDLATIKIPQR